MNRLSDSDFWKDRGNNYYRTGNYHDALICYKRAIEINPESEHAWHNLGMAYNRLNNVKESQACFDKEKEISGEHSPGVTGIHVSPELSGPENPGRAREWQDLLYPGEWCLRFVIVGLIASLSDAPVFVALYYISVVAALVAMVVMLAGFALYAVRRPVRYPYTGPVHPPAGTNSLSTSTMNVRTWILFFLICFVALLWAIFLGNQGMMIWVSIALVLIVVGFNLLFIFKR